MSKVGGKSRNGDQEEGSCRSPREMGAWIWMWVVEMRRRALRHDLGHGLVAATRGLADRMDVRVEGERGKEYNSNPGYSSALYII